MRTAVQIHLCEEPGDVLIFLTGEEEIENCCQAIREELEEESEPIMVLPLYSSLPPGQQRKVFEVPVRVAHLLAEAGAVRLGVEVGAVQHAQRVGRRLHVVPKRALDLLRRLRRVRCRAGRLGRLVGTRRLLWAGPCRLRRGVLALRRSVTV